MQGCSRLLSGFYHAVQLSRQSRRLSVLGQDHPKPFLCIGSPSLPQAAALERRQATLQSHQAQQLNQPNPAMEVVTDRGVKCCRHQKPGNIGF